MAIFYILTLIFLNKNPLALSSDKGGPNHLNSWHWKHFDPHIGQRHFGEVPYLLTPRAHGQAGLRRLQGGTPTIYGERSIGQERPCQRP